MELEEEMYIRTKKGNIYFLDEELEDTPSESFLDQYGAKIIIKDIDIIKSSYNLIDLIEVGDYVNGYKVTQVALTDNKGEVSIFKSDDWHQDYYIKSILTKEQYEANVYKVEEE